jgi:hypothetical protein
VSVDGAPFLTGFSNTVYFRGDRWIVKIFMSRNWLCLFCKCGQQTMHVSQNNEVLEEEGYLRGCVHKRHCLESVINQNGVVQSLIGILDSVQKDVFLDRSNLKRK